MKHSNTLLRNIYTCLSSRGGTRAISPSSLLRNTLTAYLSSAGGNTAQVRALATKTKPDANAKLSPTPHASSRQVEAPLSLISKPLRKKGSQNKSAIVAKGPIYVNADIQKADILNDNNGKSGIYK